MKRNHSVVHRQLHGYAGSLARFGFESDRTPQPFQHVFRQKHAQAHPFSGGFGGKERFADSFQLLRRHAWSAISNTPIPVLGIAVDDYVDRTIRRIRIQRVLDQATNRLAQTILWNHDGLLIRVFR